MLASITADSLSVWIHASAVVVGFGATFASRLPEAARSRSRTSTSAAPGASAPSAGFVVIAAIFLMVTKRGA